ncbi:MAG: V-type ATP synthase subunit A, partial [Spirochaetia bacterium]|nr:V-type ATP synthase subunit A [Spirochaetia bacterium]
QNSFDPEDATVSPERQKYMIHLVLEILGAGLELKAKDDARSWFYELRQSFLDLNGATEGSELYQSSLTTIREKLAARNPRYGSEAQKMLLRLE